MQNLNEDSLLAEVEKAKPWRRPTYLLYFFLRIMPSSIFTLVFIISFSVGFWLGALLLFVSLMLDLLIIGRSPDVVESKRQVLHFVTGESNIVFKRQRVPRVLLVPVLLFSLTYLAPRIGLPESVRELVFWGASIATILFFSRILQMNTSSLFYVERISSNENTHVSKIDFEAIVSSGPPMGPGSYLAWPIFFVPLYSIVLSFCVFARGNEIGVNGRYYCVLFFLAFTIIALPNFIFWKYKTIAQSIHQEPHHAKP